MHIPRKKKKKKKKKKLPKVFEKHNMLTLSVKKPSFSRKTTQQTGFIQNEKNQFERESKLFQQAEQRPSYIYKVRWVDRLFEDVIQSPE